MNKISKVKKFTHEKQKGDKIPIKLIPFFIDIRLITLIYQTKKGWHQLLYVTTIPQTLSRINAATVLLLLFACGSNEDLAPPKEFPLALSHPRPVASIIY